jgi:hypothetical protein
MPVPPPVMIAIFPAKSFMRAPAPSAFETFAPVSSFVQTMTQGRAGRSTGRYRALD